MLSLAKQYTSWLREEAQQTAAERAIANVGRREPKRHLADAGDQLMADNVLQSMGSMLESVLF